MELNIREIMDIIPHRYPFLLIDKIVELEEGKSAVGIKNVTMNEPFFQGHFPGQPIMPGVLIAEALAQVGAVLILKNPEFKNKIAVFTTMDGFKFKHQVKPGETLRLEVEMTKMRSIMGKASAVAYVDDKVAAKGEIGFALVDKE
ncbi:MAG: 3-hydroxyacyl-ACP dehydratase FabZ [Oscillospiraceae bacterium]